MTLYKTKAGTQPKKMCLCSEIWQLLLWYLLRNCLETAMEPPVPPKTAKTKHQSIVVLIFQQWRSQYATMPHSRTTFELNVRTSLNLRTHPCYPENKPLLSTRTFSKWINLREYFIFILFYNSPIYSISITML